MPTRSEIRGGGRFRRRSVRRSVGDRRRTSARSKNLNAAATERAVISWIARPPSGRRGLRGGGACRGNRGRLRHPSESRLRAAYRSASASRCRVRWRRPAIVDDHAEAVTGGAGAVRAVEAERARFDFADAGAAVGAGVAGVEHSLLPRSVGLALSLVAASLGVW